MIEYDIAGMLRDYLHGESRPPDGKLHPSGDLVGSLRHSQLRAAGAPTVESDITGDVRLMTGTMWHTFFEGMFSRHRLPVMTEVKLDRWLPEGWSGTADWIFWSDEYRAFILGDLKTIKGEGMEYINKDGIKTEHLWQLSSYWYALETMGLPLVKAFFVCYLPQNVPTGSNVEPSMQEGRPLDRELVLDTMKDRWHATRAYLDLVSETDNNTRTLDKRGPTEAELYLNEHLAPVQERVQIVRWTKATGVFDVKFAPHWSASYCPFPNELCDCSEQGVTKIGEYDLDGTYKPRKGYEDETPTVEPTLAQYKKQRKEKAADGQT